MAKYTTQIRTIVEQLTTGLNLPMSKRVEVACKSIFDFDYPIWLDSYRPILEKKIIMHYFNKEIGMETVGLWKFYLEERLNFIMPYYNKLYETTVKDYDYLSNTNLTETYDRKNDENEIADYSGKANSEINSTQVVHDETSGNSTDETTAKSTNTNNETVNQTTETLQSDLPQANYNGLDYGTNLNEGTQSNTKEGSGTTSANSTSLKNDSTTSDGNLTRNELTDATQTSKNNVNRKNAENYIGKRTGSSGIPLTELLVMYRDSLINIDKMIVDNLQDLFLNIY